MTRYSSPVDQAIRQAAVRYGLPESYLYRVAQVESGGNPNARNPRSSAGGLYQFIDSTAKQYGLQDRFDPVQAADAMGRLTLDNRNHLSRVLGRAPTEAELYLAHQQGAGGAARLLQNPHANAAQLVGSNAVGLNAGNNAMRAGDFANRVFQ
ncbi:transglycosylase SLT domain-containing protein, partial [Bartonella sp. ML70XJBT.G]|uniref:transglycosylase SLT domain-containing protein n=1 Tax=Bartonella sp. ML70XJBT.G TaxID=3019093 RepID=UPI00236038D5